MRTLRHRAAVSVVAVSALALAACSPGGGGETANRVSIASIMGMDQDEWSPESQRKQEDLIQESIARCMAEQGWEYIPVVYPNDFSEYTDEDEEARIKREGLGIAYWTLNQGGDEFYEDPWADFVDPNTAYVESLSEAEMTAYYEALYGTQEEQEAETVLEIDPETGEEYYVSYGYGTGCQGKAYEEVYGEDQNYNEDYWEAISKFYEELYLRVEADPRMVKLNTDWSGCMKSAGFDFKTRMEFWEKAYEEYYERHNEILGPDYYADPFDGWTESQIDDFWNTASDAEIDAMFNRQQSLTDDQRAQLEELLADEIKLATANFECEKGFREKEQDIYAEIEAAYAEENRAELEALAASLGNNS
ncbi:MAG: hypothetical protein CVT64_02095 [Actinobacteria bacterium HGW-Actinobacteria-4]|nr:MAG: hypothetical protein CVT64_02095 [Actinobacteria bacterium HGW-Actinobacteria-4]